jgi:DNA segregation ATPase FtsK/SpoIIIE, S-DNA-T family
MSKSTTVRRRVSKAAGPSSDRKLLIEVVGLCMLGMAVAVLLALVSYNSADPSWRKTSVSDDVHNWLGPVGAYTAGMLHQALGYASYLIPLALVVLAFSWMLEPRLRFSLLKLFGLVLIFLSATGLLDLAQPAGSGTAFYWGGAIGHILVSDPTYGLAHFLNTTGTVVALGTAMLTGLLLTTSLSLVALLVHLSPQERKAGLLSSLSERFRSWRQNREAAREQRSLASQPESRQQGSGRLTLIPSERQGTGELRVDSRLQPSPLSPLAPLAASIAGRDLSQPIPREPLGFDDPELNNFEEESPALVARVSQPPVETRPEAAAASAGGEGTNGHFPKPAEPPEQKKEPVEQPLFDEIENESAVLRPKAAIKGRSTKISNGANRVPDDFKLPDSEMLVPPVAQPGLTDAELDHRAAVLKAKCEEFNVSGQVQRYTRGPVVTTFEFKPDTGVKYSRVTSLVDDLCLGLKAESIRIDRLPGKSTVGIEVPNRTREIIRLREVIESDAFQNSPSKLTLALGKTIDGTNYVADLTRMPHLLIAGATGAGKSVALNAILVSLLFKASPQEVKLILVDPKRLELGLYADIPHLLTPIVTDPKRASYALKWAVSEMESRYKHLAMFGVRNIEQYNQEVCATVDPNLAKDSENLPRPLPFVVVIIDELADLMMVSARDVEESITRLAQMARAVGIHLVLATQRPSVDVITGLIKANFPSRISFRVSSKVDSRTIIDTNGAEALLGQGDMLFLPPGTSRLVRVHGAYVDEKEVKKIADYVRTQANPRYDEKIQMSEKEIEGEEMGDLRRDEKYDEALRIVIEMGRASTSVLQRRLRIGYGRAASIIDMMHREGIVGPEDGSKPRQVLVKADFLERLDEIREEEGAR